MVFPSGSSNREAESSNEAELVPFHSDKMRCVIEAEARRTTAVRRGMDNTIVSFVRRGIVNAATREEMSLVRREKSRCERCLAVRNDGRRRGVMARRVAFEGRRVQMRRKRGIKTAPDGSRMARARDGKELDGQFSGCLVREEESKTWGLARGGEPEEKGRGGAREMGASRQGPRGNLPRGARPIGSCGQR